MFECQTWWYVKKKLGFKRLIISEMQQAGSSAPVQCVRLDCSLSWINVRCSDIIVLISYHTENNLWVRKTKYGLWQKTIKARRYSCESTCYFWVQFKTKLNTSANLLHS